MRRAQRRHGQSLLSNYTPQLGVLIERRHTELGLLAAKQEADRAATIARQAMFDAQAADRAKTTFLANMSHELRTPLNAIMGFSEMIELDKGQHPDRHSQYAGYIHQSAQHLLGIVNDILDLARIEAGKLGLDEQVELIEPLIHALVQTIRPLSEQKSITISSCLAISQLRVRADYTKLGQILLNVLGNAVKFTATGGRIHIDSGLDSGGDLIMAVSDSGIGIAPENISKVFEPFEQAEDHLARKGSGTGLGLPIARALARLHGGELSLRSQLGVGTRVELRLPQQRILPVSETIDSPQLHR